MSDCYQGINKVILRTGHEGPGGNRGKVYSLRWYWRVSRKTTNYVVYYLLLRLHVSALALCHHQVSTLSLTPTIDGVVGKRHTSADLTRGKSPITYCIGHWVGPRAGLNGCRKSRLHGNSTTGPFST